MALPAQPGRHSARRPSCPEMTDPYRGHPLSDLQTGSWHRATLAGKQIEVEGVRNVAGLPAITPVQLRLRQASCSAPQAVAPPSSARSRAFVRSCRQTTLVRPLQLAPSGIARAFRDG
jgi:hypothetical protein